MEFTGSLSATWALVSANLMGCAFSSADLVGDGIRVRLVKELARGGFSQVFLCEDCDSHEQYAVKKIQINQPGDQEKIQFEADQHRNLAPKSTNIVPLLALIEMDSSLHLVFPFYSRGTLFDELTKRREKKTYLSQTDVIKYSLEICSALAVVHSSAIAHRDLKTANLMLNEAGSILLMDFGSAMRIPQEVTTKNRQRFIDDCAENCSMPYRAPELFSCDIGTNIDEKIDIWSLGCCIYAICYFVSPFDLAYEKGNSVALAAQSPHKIDFPADAPYDDGLAAILRGILKVEAEDRPPLEDIREALKQLMGRQDDGKTFLDV